MMDQRHANICTDFKGPVRGDVEYASLYVPILKKMVDLGRVIHWLLLLQELPTNHLAQK